MRPSQLFFYARDARRIAKDYPTNTPQGLEMSSARMVVNWEASARTRYRTQPYFVLICAGGAPFSPILLILPIEESIAYVFSAMV